MMTSKHVLLLVAGFALVAAAIGVSLIGMRTLAHGIGYAGIFILIAGSLMLTKIADAKQPSTLTLIVATVIFVAVVLGAGRLEVISGKLATLFAVLAIYALATRLVINELVYLAGKALRQRGVVFKQLSSQTVAILAALGLTCTMSLGWELLYQPLIDVYGKGPSGRIDYWQLIADLVGIVMGLALTIRLAGSAGQRQHQVIQAV